MDNQIFQSVIEITEQRDLDSLEYSLIATLAELCRIDSIYLYKLYDAFHSTGIEVAIHLEVNRDDKGENQFEWDNSTKQIEASSELLETIQSKALVTRVIEKHAHYWFPISINGDVVGVLAITSQESIESSLNMVSGFIKIYENYLYILNESERDKLTGLLNRKTFDGKLARLLEVQKTHQTTSTDERRLHQDNDSAWLVILDVDHFKAVNDEFGHVYGDEVLLHLSQLMKKFFRSSDLLFRFGGEEFVIVMEPVPAEMVSQTLETFRAKVEAYRFPLVGSLTVSIGYIAISQSDFPLTALDNADKALYYAKAHGRNCIHKYEDLVLAGALKGVHESGSVDLF